MDVSIQWQDETKRIVRLDCSGIWNWHDLDTQMDQWLIEHLAFMDGLRILVDVRKVTMIPNDLILHVKPAVQFAQEANARIVVVAASSAAITMFNLFVTVYKSVGQKFQLASNEEEALTILDCAV
jgi:hypothetical protein